MSIFAVVVWFNPKSQYLSNILTYCEFVDGIIIVDDSTQDNSNLAQGIPKATYLSAAENRGIAKALNAGYQEAIAKGADWVLTMDQDSKFTPENISAFIKNASTKAESDCIAIFSPRFQRNRSKYDTEECDSVITSGSLISMKAYNATTGYNEELFIDQVDHEFCFRLRKAGYRILRLNDIFMEHTVGTPITKRILLFQLSTSNHNHIRRYYITRNRLYVRKNHPEFGTPYIRMIVMDLIKVALIEENKFRKFKYIAMGAIDYLRGIKGKLSSAETDIAIFKRTQ